MRIFLADLGHNQITFSSDVYPLGVANLASYVRDYAGISQGCDISIFREPQDLKSALDADTPDILGLSSYSWNHELSLHFAQYAKAGHRDVLTLMGGPNFPLDFTQQQQFLRNMMGIDVAVRGPVYEGERSLLNIVRRYDHVKCSMEGLFEEPVAGCMWVHPKTGEVVIGEEVPRIENLDEIPSPYLSGWMDPFFSTGYFPMMQISRGCPFRCTFCNSSPTSNSRIFCHSVENVMADLEYIARRIKPETPLCFADDNFGMFALDEEIADCIADLQERVGWPKYIRTTTGKNRGDRIVRVMRKLHGSLPMTAAVQSLNPGVLKNIERDNIKLETYTEIQREVAAQGMQSYGELILCLPGETKASFMKAVHDLLETGVKRVSVHQLMLLNGAPISNPETRKKFGFQTRFRVVARNLGNYTGEPVIETEEMVVATSTFSFEEYIEARVFHLLLTIYFYEGNFEEAFRFAEQANVKPFDLVVQLQHLLHQAPAGMQRLIQDFVRESKEELFLTKDECIDWAKRNFAALLDGTLGGNLLSKYSMLGRFYFTAEVLDFLELAMVALLKERANQKAIENVVDYLRCISLKAPFHESLSETPEFVTLYNVESWKAEGYIKRLESYPFNNPAHFLAVVDSEQKALILNRIETFGEHPSGLGKFTRTLFARDLRRRVIPSWTTKGPA